MSARNTTTDDELEEILVAVYNQGYVDADNLARSVRTNRLKPEEALSKLQQLIQSRETAARMDELGGIQLDYGHRVAQTFVNGEAMTVQERYEELEALLNQSQKRS